MRLRNFSKIGDAISVPDLAELQRVAYERALQPSAFPRERKPLGLEAVFRDFFPIQGADGKLRMEYLGYELGHPLRTEEECRALRLTYACPLRVRLRVVGAESVEETVYLCDVPKMIGSGSYIINGSERVVVTQIQRSPGVDFSQIMEEGGRQTYSCRFIPERGIWIEFSITRRETLQVRLGQSGKMPGTWLLRAMLPEGASDADILGLCYRHKTVALSGKKTDEAVINHYLAGDIVDKKTGEVIASAGTKISRDLFTRLATDGLKKIVILEDMDDPLLLNTLAADACKSHNEALLRIYNRFRPGEPATPDRAARFFAERFADTRYYTLGPVGRFRINRKFGQDVPTERLTLCPEDILNAIRYIMRLRRREGTPDDIDNLGNRIVRPMDKLLDDRLREAFSQWRRQISDGLVTEADKLPSPRDVAGTRSISTAIDDFFSHSELSQVLDQTNPLAEINHLRRISALGPGGLNRKRAGFEVRDVHASHYGRICPIETPEGANIGLISSLGIFARVDDYGFITTPYVHPKSATGSRSPHYLRADEEKDRVLSPALKLQEAQSLLARYGEDFLPVKPENVDWQDVSPKQSVGVSAALIPFLEHNDANRALMGSNMQKQAVPLLRTEQPYVLTGMEGPVASSSSMVIRAQNEGVVEEVDAAHVRISGRDYLLRKFSRLGEGTCQNQKPLVSVGQAVAAGQVIADGAATNRGKLSLGRNVLVGFMIWDGYNFEDAIIISDSLVQSDKYTSIHLEEFVAELRETHAGREEFTADIPNVSQRMLANLDESGAVRVGAKVEPGDILVGKVAPKTKTELTPEEKLLREIFGKSGIDVTNESLTVPPGSGGVVVDVQRFRRKTQLSDDERADDRRDAHKEEAELDQQIADLFSEMILQLSALPRQKGELPKLPASAILREKLQAEREFHFDSIEFAADAKEASRRIYQDLGRRMEQLKAQRDHIVRHARAGDELAPGCLELVKVTVATKRALSVGDKMAGRHGNKGVIARVVPREDMPYLEDGTPVEVLLNPLGVPSRMNVGQILETHLSWAAQALGFHAVSPIFDGAGEDEIAACLKEAGLPPGGKAKLRDGRTGEQFDQEVTVGYIYLMKLNHLVDDKIHARSTGPYSMITQQPLGGKARMGGQRLGEMEVWALEAYGAAYVLQEMLTVKSDDVEGRSRLYESAIKGPPVLDAGLPVSFDVLMNEIRGSRAEPEAGTWE